jgi:predicted ATPase/DNA-binding CsgD family transcriptional regulator
VADSIEKEAPSSADSGGSTGSREDGSGSLEAFPGGRSTERPSNNLPLELSSFVGREREIDEVKGLLESTRLLTLTGAGGCGKTRLALRVAKDLVGEFKDGVWMAEVASLSSPELVAQAVAQALGVREQPDRPLDATLVDALRSKQLLLVLDNCEHLLEATARLVETMLVSCPELRVLSTSREALGIGGEVNRVVPSLSVPDPRFSPQELEGYESVRLFTERARYRNPSFVLSARNVRAVAEICRRLDGIPLAIELAAVRVGVLSAEQIASRLDDSLKLLRAGGRSAVPRHRTLGATLDWSYELLSKPEQKLFGRLSMFVGSWTLEAAEAVVAGEGIEQENILDLLGRLVDKSLVVTEESGEEEGASFLRYRMLEPVRQYALERLVEGGEAEEIRRRYAAYFVALAEEAEPKLTTVEQMIWLERLEADHNNLRAVLSWSLGVGEPETALRLGAALSRFWFVRGYTNEGLGWLEEALSLSAKGAEPLRARALNGAGHLAWSQGDLDRAQALREESLALSRQAGDKREIANALNGLGIVTRRRGNFEAARDLHEEALTVSRELDDRWVVAQSIDLLGRAAAFQGDYAAALPRLEEALKMYWKVGESEGIAKSTAVMGMVALGQGDYSTASLHLREAQKILSDLGDQRGIGMMKTTLGDAALNRGERDAAYSLYEEALRDLKYVGDKWWIAWCLEGMAGLAVAREQSARAARLFGAARALRGTIGAPRPPAFRSYHDRNLATIRDRLGEAAFEAAFSEGRAMSPEQAIEYALSAEEEEQEESASVPATKTAPKPSVSSSSYPPAGLSAREAEVLKLVAEGLTNTQIAERLFISPRTVDRHLNSTYAKLKVGSRAAATRFAIEHGLA